MKTTKLLLIVVGLIFSVQTFAQVKIGIKAGGNVCHMKFDIAKDLGGEPETKAKMGFHIGLITDIPLLENTFSLQPALLYSNKGYSFDMEEILDDEFAGSDIDIDDYKSGIMVRLNFGEDLQALAARTLGNPDKWIDIAIANGLKAQFLRIYSYF